MYICICRIVLIFFSVSLSHCGQICHRNAECWLRWICSDSHCTFASEVRPTRPTTSTAPPQPKQIGHAIGQYDMATSEQHPKSDCFARRNSWNQVKLPAWKKHYYMYWDFWGTFGQMDTLRETAVVIRVVNKVHEKQVKKQQGTHLWLQVSWIDSAKWTKIYAHLWLQQYHQENSMQCRQMEGLLSQVVMKRSFKVQLIEIPRVSQTTT